MYDFISYAYQKYDNGVYARKTFGCLVSQDSEHRNEVLGFCPSLKIPGPRQRTTPVANMKGLQRLLVLLESRVSAKFRRSTGEIFAKFLAGDKPLIEAIKVNAASHQPIAQMARARRAALVESIQNTLPAPRDLPKPKRKRAEPVVTGCCTVWASPSLVTRRVNTTSLNSKRSSST